MERETGNEPATNSLEGCHSTTELLPPSSLRDFHLRFFEASADRSAGKPAVPRLATISPSHSFADPASSAKFADPASSAKVGLPTEARLRGVRGERRLVGREGFEPS